MTDIIVTVIVEIDEQEIYFVQGTRKGTRFKPGRTFKVLSQGTVNDPEVLVATSDDPSDNARIPKNKLRWPTL